MTLNLKPQITIFKVKNNAAKLQLICKKATEAFEMEKPLIIVVNDMQAAHFIDELLWKSPDFSFLPHAVTDMPTTEYIAISMQSQKNINKAVTLFNTLPTLPPFFDSVAEIYDMFDETHPQKLAQSQERCRLYKEQGHTITLVDYLL